MDEKNAYILTNILQSVVTARITVGVKFSYPVAGKLEQPMTAKIGGL